MLKSELLLTIEGRDAARSGRGQKLREAAGLSRSELADLAGVSRPAISRWESRRRVPRGDNAVAYARALREIAEELMQPHE
jgi:transcriptional regulator with XRE-family HTH domain